MLLRMGFVCCCPIHMGNRMAGILVLGPKVNSRPMTEHDFALLRSLAVSAGISMEKADLFWHQQVIWVKHNPVLCRKDMLLDHEWCFYGWKKGAGHQWFGPRNVRNVWEVTKVPAGDR